jgi:glutamyl endopeptidase
MPDESGRGRSAVLDRLADRADYAVVGPTDGRTRVLNARITLFCRMPSSDFGMGARPDAGFPASPTTSPHVIVAQFSRRAICRSGMERRPDPRPRAAMAGQAAVRVAVASRWYGHRRFGIRRTSAYDVGIIVVPRPFPEGPAPPLPSTTRLAIGPRQGFTYCRLSKTNHEERCGNAERLDRIAPRALYYSNILCPDIPESGLGVGRGAAGLADVIGIHVADQGRMSAVRGDAALKCRWRRPAWSTAFVRRVASSPSANRSPGRAGRRSLHSR